MVVLYILIFLSVTGTVLPYIDDTHWIIRGQSYFRAIYLALNFLLFIAVGFFMPMGIVTILLLITLSIMTLLCARSVLPFTSFGKVEVELLDSMDEQNSLHIFIFNVYQYNTDYQRTLKTILESDPDVIFLVETSSDWKNGLAELNEKYPYRFDEVKQNTYGLMMFSKVEVLEGGINHLVKSSIPSAELLVNIGGRKVRILGLHPEPPVPGESTSTYYKDRELAQTARYLSTLKEDDHQILVGDLNDVAWSRASIAFKKATNMKDPRAGRGFYSTFPTWFPIKIPLDHVFCSSNVQLIDFTVLPNIGSDHYPIEVKFHIP